MIVWNRLSDPFHTRYAKSPPGLAVATTAGYRSPRAAKDTLRSPTTM